LAEPFVRITPARGIEQPLGDRLRTMVPLLRSWIRRELRVRYRQSVLRASWSLIQPVTILLTYGLILTQVLDVSAEDAPYLTFAWTGIVVFTFVQQCLGQGVGCIQQAGPLISRVYFPREVLPLAVVGTAAVDLAVMTGLLVAVSWIQVGPPTVHLLGLVPVYLAIALWSAGIALCVSALTVFRRDLNHAMPLILRVLFIVSPVMYPASLLPGPAEVNPITAAIEGARDAVYRGTWPDPLVMGGHILAGCVVLVAGYAVLRRLERRMGDFA
jgi:lipopolysaccharide transport system permease protein